jgi:patatin-like phospholipase/acyl hydrolase
MRGIYSANYLLRLTENFARKNGSQSIDLGKQFDLVTGTSTGAFIACGLAAGIDLEKIVNMYLEYGKQIFRLQLPHGSRGMVLMRLVKDILCRGKYLAEGTSSLRKALQSCFGSETLGMLYERRQIAVADNLTKTPTSMEMFETLISVNSSRFVS